ncbi:M48 family metalloprotease [Actinoplanes palleronii]|uniref:Peptidase M48 domain-containing protein n=1 Tax=Actinoplanes palleronii TaxID=113570 RepID=A0ABQ4BNF6_9ACTN|nr:M48 family metalloprotease [Actinoplanes palleronii]GIE71740.1 hypothetical protein Apa02nite_078480 [Actinoplanes palleronii]
MSPPAPPLAPAGLADPSVPRFVTVGLSTVAAAMFAGHWFLGLRAGTGGRCAAATDFTGCTSLARGLEARAVLAGPAVLLAVAVLIYFGRPALIRLRRHRPLPPDGPMGREIRARAAAAGLSRPPRPEVRGAGEMFVYGAWPPYRLVVPLESTVSAIKGSPLDSALLAHELGHARTGDATRYGATMACWYASLLVVVVPVAVDAWRLAGPGQVVAPQLTWRLLAVTGMLVLAVRSANRAREFAADARAFRDDPAARAPVGADRTPALIAAIGNGTHGPLRIAPSPRRRLAVLAEPALLSRPAVTGVLVAGAGAGLLGTELALLVELAFPGDAWTAYLVAALLTAVPAIGGLGLPAGLRWWHAAGLGAVFGGGLLIGTQLAPRASADWWAAFPTAGGRAAQLDLTAAAPATAVVVAGAALLLGVGVAGWAAAVGARPVRVLTAGVALLGVPLAIVLLAVRLAASSGWSPAVLAATLLTPARVVPLVVVLTVAMLALLGVGAGAGRTARAVRVAVLSGLWSALVLVAVVPWSYRKGVEPQPADGARWDAIAPPPTGNPVYACLWIHRLGPAGLPGPAEPGGLQWVGGYLTRTEDPVLRQAGQSLTDPASSGQALLLMLARCDSVLSVAGGPLPKAS